MGLWPHDEPPTLIELISAARCVFEAPLRELEPPDIGSPDGVTWHAALEVPGHDLPILVWVEPSRPLSPDEIDDPRALGCRWALGAETLLDGADPVAGYTSLMRLLTGSFEDIPAVLDANCGRWHPAETIRRDFIENEVEPPAEALWVIHAVTRGARAGAWLHTHGLWRCGVPELEMLDVPADLAPRAAELLNAIASRLLEEPLPDPGEAFGVGVDLAVTLRPWQEIAPHLADVPGGAADRSRPDDVHGGVRAVVCAWDPTGARSRAWPMDVLSSLDSGDGLLFLSRRATDRAAALAQRTWPQLATAFATLPGHRRRSDDLPPAACDRPAARFILKAGLAPDAPTSDGDDGGRGDREHMWFVVRRFQGDRAEAVLMNDPVLARRMRRGDVLWIERGAVSDWSVVTPAGSFGPDDLDGLSAAIDALRAARDEVPR